MFRRLLRLILKELQVTFGDPKARMLLIGPVVLQTLIFPFAATLEVRNASVVVLNEDGGAASIELLQRLSHTPAFAKLASVHGEKALREALDGQEALLALRIPATFSRNLRAGRPAAVQVLIDGRRSNSGQIAAGYLAQVLQESAGSGRPPARLEVRPLYNPNLEFRWHVLPSLVGIITTIGCLMVTALSVAREREEGTFDQLLVSPLTPAYLMVGKAVPGVLVAMAQGSFIALAAVFAYGMPFTGSVLVLLAGMFCYGLALAGIGLFISSVSSNQQQAFLGVFAFMSPAVMLSGYVAPVENMPLFFQVLARMNPLTYFIPIAKGSFLRAYGFSEAWPFLWPLLGVAACTLAAALYLFRRHIA
jgi:ABC-2 type transport system permease protein